MKRKLIKRNKSLLFELCKTAKKHDLLLSDLLCLIKRKSDICGFIKADEKGLLTEDWSQAEFDKGLVSVPKVDPNGKIDTKVRIMCDAMLQKGSERLR